MRCVLVIFEFLELTRAFAVPYVCDCGVIWRLMVLGVECPRAGATDSRPSGLFELWSCDGVSWTGTSARCLLLFVRLR